MPDSSPAGVDSIHTLYVDHHGWLQNWLRRRLSCSEQAADLAQDTFVRMLASDSRNFGKRPRALLQRVARNLVIDHWRRHEVQRAYFESIANLPEPEAPSPETQALIVEALLQIQSALSNLPALTQTIFELSQFDGLKQHEIAAQLNVCVNSVRRHLTRALAACIMAGWH